MNGSRRGRGIEGFMRGGLQRRCRLMSGGWGGCFGRARRRWGIESGIEVCSFLSFSLFFFPFLTRKLDKE